MDVPLAEVVAASRTVAATRSRTAKTQALADLFAADGPALLCVQQDAQLL